MQQSELKHELVLPEKFPLIRLYRMFWGKNAPLDFCHLFWGTLFFWVVPLFFAVLSPVLLCIVAQDKIKGRNQEQRLARSLEPPKLRKYKPPLRSRVAMLDAFITAVTKFGMWWKWTLRPWYRTHLRKPVNYGLAGLSILVVAGGLIIGLYHLIPLLIGLPGHIWETIGLVVLGFLGVLALAGAIVLLVNFIYDRKYHERMAGYVVAPPMTAFRFMRLAYYYVKTNTCPRIVISGETEAELHEGETR